MKKVKASILRFPSRIYRWKAYLEKNETENSNIIAIICIEASCDNNGQNYNKSSDY